jgi:hypothetical protein
MLFLLLQEYALLNIPIISGYRLLRYILDHKQNQLGHRLEGLGGGSAR